MRGRYVFPWVLALVFTLLPVSADAQAQAVGVRCRDVQAGDYRATHVFADFMPCRSVRAKLRRWLPGDRLPQKPNGWYCYRLSEVVRACSYPGKRNANRSFTFWLRRASRAQTAAPIRECGDYAPGGGFGVYNITTRVTPCRIARRMARRFYHGDWDIPRDSRPFRRGSYTCRNRNIAIEEADLRCTASRGRVVHWQHGA
jgi:hypothetical protein